MFTKSKVSQSLIDAVSSITSVDEAIKIPTATGTKVLGRSYGNSAKAHLDQTKKDIDTIKGPKTKELKAMDKEPKRNFDEELKGETFEFDLTEGSYDDLHKKWGDTHNIEYHSHTLYPKHTVTKFDNEKDAESHAKKTGGTVRMSVSPKMNEELKGNQDKIDANHNGKIDGQDFKILRGKKKIKEGNSFAARLINHARFAEEIEEELNEVLSKDASAGDWIHDFIHSDNPKFSGKSKAERKKMALGAYYGKHNEGYEGSEADEKEDKKGEKETGMTDAQYEKSARDKKEDKAGKKKMKEEVDTGITTDTLTGREAGGKSNDFKSFKLKVKGDHTPEKDPSCENPEETSSRQTIKAKGGLGDKVDNLDAKYGKPNSFKEETELDETDRSDAIEKQSKDNLTKSMKAMGKNDRQIKYFHKKTDDVIKKAAGEKVKKEEVELDEASPAKNQDVADKSWLKDAGKKPTVKSDLKNFGRFLAGKKETNEETQLEEAVSRKDFQMVADLIKTHDDHDKRKMLAQHHAEVFHRQNPRFDRAKFMSAANVNEAKTLSPGQDDAPFDAPYTTTPSDVKDKSGAIHTPMSRAKDLARQAFKKIKNETMMGKISN